MFSKFKVNNMKYFLRWFLARTWKNFGKVTDNIYRSGQMGRIRLPLTVKYWDIEYIIALNIGEDNTNSREEFEKEFCKEKDIKTIQYDWSAGRNDFPDQLQQVIDILEYNDKNNVKTLIHCAGGKDRTGGALGCWMLTGESYKSDLGILESFVEHCAIHKIPAEGWLREVFYD